VLEKILDRLDDEEVDGEVPFLGGLLKSRV